MLLLLPGGRSYVPGRLTISIQDYHLPNKNVILPYKHHVTCCMA